MQIGDDEVKILLRACRISYAYGSESRHVIWELSLEALSRSKREEELLNLQSRGRARIDEN